MGSINGSTNGSSKHTSAADEVPPTRLYSGCYPNPEKMVARLDAYYLENWPFESEAEKEKFLKTNLNYYGCLAFPRAKDDQSLFGACLVATLLFVIDDVVERKEVEEGRAYYQELLDASVSGAPEPAEKKTHKWVMWDIFRILRENDEQTGDENYEGTKDCLLNQTEFSRLDVRGLEGTIEYRMKDIGSEFNATAGRAAMCLHITPEEHASITDLFTLYTLILGSINDVYSFDRELNSYTSSPSDCGVLINLVQGLRSDTLMLEIPAAKRVAWNFIREWERRFLELKKERLECKEGCSEHMVRYLDVLETSLSGYEIFCSKSWRYGGWKKD